MFIATPTTIQATNDVLELQATRGALAQARAELLTARREQGLKDSTVNRTWVADAQTHLDELLDFYLAIR